jgi:hypothetical protein
LDNEHFKYSVAFDRHIQPRKKTNGNKNNKHKHKTQTAAAACLLMLLEGMQNKTFLFTTRKNIALSFTFPLILTPCLLAASSKKKHSTLFDMVTKTFFPQKLYFFLWLYWWGKRGEKKRVECETAHFGERKCAAGAPLQPIVVDTCLSLFLIIHKPCPYVALNAKKIFEKK